MICTEKYQESDSDDPIPGPINLPVDDLVYDSDEDPVWTPFSMVRK